MADNEVSMMMSVYPGAMTGFAALNSGLVSINNIFMQTMARIDDNFGLIDTSIVATGAVVAQFAADSMHAFGEFEQGMKIVQMVSGQTANDISYLSQKANEFSVSYRTDIDQITEGLQTLGRAGLNSASEQAEVLQNGLSTAKLEGRDLNGVLQELIQNTALLGGNLKSNEFGEDSQYINDLLVATSMTAPITTHDISETLKYSGGIAAAAGAQIRDEEGNVNEQGKAILEDYMGAIAAFAQKGVSGSIAGTALRAFFNKPATQDSSVTEALASIHLKPEYLWEEDEETMKPVSEQIRIIKNQMDELNVSTMDQLQIWSKIVGGKMGQQMMKLDAESIKDITKDIRAADDATSLAKQSMKTYEANIKAIGESGAALQRNIGQGLVMVANPFLEIIARFLEFANNDFTGFPIAMTIIGFLGMVAKRIKAIVSQLFSEIGTVFSALKAGANMITARDLKGEKGKRDLLPGEKYTQSDFQKDITPGNLLKQFRQQFQNEAAKSLVGLSKENAAIIEASKGWSKESEYLTSKNVKYVSDDGKSFMQARDNQVIAQLARNNMLSPEIQKAFFMGTKKEEIMSTVLSSGATVREEIESLFIQLQTELQKTATVLNEASVAAEKASGAEEKQTATKQSEATKTTEVIESGAEKNVLTTAEMAAKMEQELLDMAATITASTAEMSAQVKNNVATMFPNRMTMVDPKKIFTNSNVPNIPILTSGSFWDPDMVRRANDTGQTHSGIFWNTSLLQKGLAYQNDMFEDQEKFRKIFGIPKNVPENPYSKDGMFYDPTTGRYIPNLNNLFNEIGKGSEKSGGLPPNFITRYFYDKETGIASSSVPHYAPGEIGPHPRGGYTFPGTIPFGMDMDKALEKYKEDYITTKIQTGKGVHASNYDALLKSTGIDYEALDKEALARKNAALEQSNMIAEEIKQELLTISNALTKQQAAFEREQANIAQNQKDMKGLANAAGINAAKQAEEGGNNVERKAAKQAETEAKMNALLRPQNEADMVHEKSDSTFYSSTTPPMSPNPYDRDTINHRYEQERAFAQQEKEERDAAAKEKRIRDERLKIRKERQDAAYKDSSIGGRIRSKLGRAEPVAYDPYNYNATMFPTLFGGKPLPVEDKTPPQKKPGMIASLSGTLKDRWNQDRAGRFLNFGQGRVGGKLNGALNMLDAVGGPFMVAMMVIPAILNYVKGIYEDYTRDLKEIKESIKESYSKRQEAEDSLKKTYREQNPDADKEAANDYVLKQYGKMYDSLMKNGNDFSEWIKKTSQKTDLTKKYEVDSEKDDGSMKEVKEEEKSEEEALKEAVKENNSALYEATAQLQLATNKLVTKMEDGVWGIDGFSSELSDSLGSAQDTWLGFTDGSGSIENGFLKTASQKDENYAGDTELTGLMLEDFKDSQGDWRQGLRKIFGSDFDDITSTMNTGAIKAMRSMGQFANSLGKQKNARLQSSMMNDRKSWQGLAKEMAKYEKKTGKHAMNVADTKNTRMENLIKKLQIDTHLSRAQVIAAAQLQQLQDMYQVSEQSFVPLMATQAETASRLYNTTAKGIAPQAGSAAGGAVGTEQNSAAIAAYLSVMAQNAALEAAYQQDVLDGNTTAKSKEQYLQEAAGQHIKFGINVQDEKGLKAGTDPTFVGIDTTIGGDIEKQKRIAHALEYQGDRIRNPEWTDQEVSNYSKRIDKLIDKGMSFSEAMKKARENYAGAAATQLEAAYLGSSVGEEEDSGSGGGSGSGSGDKDKNNTGTKKERVDLVLCSKKEIPKLNVNLFKKPPTFTVLNKNFKVRDVKINTEDTPKAIMSAIKNSFIDVQKRSDPKIIQDEEGVYNPEQATDGNPLPSGSAKTRTD